MVGHMGVFTGGFGSEDFWRFFSGVKRGWLEWVPGAKIGSLQSPKITVASQKWFDWSLRCELFSLETFILWCHRVVQLVTDFSRRYLSLRFCQSASHLGFSRWVVRNSHWALLLNNGEEWLDVKNAPSSPLVTSFLEKKTTKISMTNRPPKRAYFRFESVL